MLLMKRIFFASIRQGRKTTTLRYWKSPRVRAGSVHTVPGLGKVRIEEAAPVAFGELTEADALADGFQNLRQLRRALQDMYPARLRKGRTLYRVRFSVVD